jgi:AcrR family transcriptional regulator
LSGERICATTPTLLWSAILQKKAPADDGGKASLDLAPKNRMERRREDTRRRLMRAAFGIIARRGFEGLVIQDITEAADVGHGSFYNHFTSKDAIVQAIVDAARVRIKSVYECMAGLTDDRVEAFARDLRMCLYLSQTDEVWGWFVIRTVLSGKELRNSIRGNIQRGIHAGIRDNAFKHHDIEMAYETIAGLLLLGTLKLASGEAPDDYLEKIVSTALKTLSVPDGKIKEVMSKPLPELNLQPFLNAAG